MVIRLRLLCRPLWVEPFGEDAEELQPSGEPPWFLPVTCDVAGQGMCFVLPDVNQHITNSGC